ncbi:MAG: metal-sulfur cluster assembly factor [Chloroflexota bacterium]
MVQNTLNALVNEELVYTALKQVIDPELGINVVDLGLIYAVHIGDDGSIGIEMTLTTPGCPLHASVQLS